MPKARFNTQSAKDYITKYGYTLNDNFHYTNMNAKIRMYDVINEKYVEQSMKQLIYHTEQATVKRPEFDTVSFERFMNIDFQPGRIGLDKETRQEIYDIINDIQPQPGRVRNEDRFLENNPATLEYINNVIPKSQVEQFKSSILKQLTKTVKTLKQAIKNESIIVLDMPKDDDIDEQAMKQTLLLSIQILKKQLLSKNVNITLTSSEGDQKSFYLNENSINLLNDALFNDNIPDTNDSNTEILKSYYIKNVATITIEIEPFKQLNRINAGFFPYINISTIDLTKYGIYSSLNDVNLTESCLITAIRNSKVLNDDEMNRLQHFVKTRTYLLEELPLICNEFDVQIDLKIISKKGTDSHRSYGKSERIIKLIVMFGHYMFNELPNVCSYFINHYDECKDMNTMTYKKDGEYNIGKTSLNIITLINKMIEYNLLIPLTDEQFIDIVSNFEIEDNNDYNHMRLVNVPDVRIKSNPFSVKPKQTKFFFGYAPDDDEVDERIKELQKVIDSLPLRHHIDVSSYYRCSNLMNKIMFEYGCYDDVYESSGYDNQQLRESIHFPRPHSDYHNGKPFEIHNEKLYYIDMNSSYMSFINGIPTDLSMKERNYKINDLIHTLFDLRKQYKQSNPKLATTLKYLMNSCYGFSLRKQKTYKRKYSSNISNYLNNYGNYVFAVYPTSSFNEGFVYSKQSFTTDYNTVQFGADILNNYNNFMDEIRSKVNVIYENIDAILITEDDFKKLQNEGLIGDKLGQFKLEHIFDRFVYKSGRKWQGYFNGELIEKRGKW